MSRTRNPENRELTALLIAADGALAHSFAAAEAAGRSFQIVAELKSYPAGQTVGMRLQQLRPDAVLIDLATDLNAACETIRSIHAISPATPVVGIHRSNDPEAILRSVQAGANEFLHAPFEAAHRQEAAARIRRSMGGGTEPAGAPGEVVAFSGVRTGAGASTIAREAAFALRRATGKSVLLADLDFAGCHQAFALRVAGTPDILTAMRRAREGEAIARPFRSGPARGDVDVFPAPALAGEDAADPEALHAFLDRVRGAYDFVLLDLPVVFDRLSLLALSASDRACLVSTAELPSLHLARRAVDLLLRLGFPKDRFQLLINRCGTSAATGSDLGKLFPGAGPIRLPEDYSIWMAAARAKAAGPGPGFGKAIVSLAEALAAGPAGFRAKETSPPRLAAAGQSAG